MYTLKRLLQQMLAVKKTISQDLRVIDEHYGDYLDLQFNQTTASMRVKSIGMLFSIYAEMFKESLEYQILIDIFFNPYQKIESISNKHYCSISQAYRSIYKINESLMPYEVKITSSSAGYFIDGKNEHHLRILMTKTLLLQGKHGCYYQDMPKDLVYTHLLKLFKKKRFSWFIENKIEELMILYIVSLHRENQEFIAQLPLLDSCGQSIDESIFEEIKRYFPNVQYRESIYQIKLHFEKMFCPKAHTPYQEIINTFTKHYLSFHPIQHGAHQEYQMREIVSSFVSYVFAFPYPPVPFLNRAYLFGEQFKRRHPSPFKAYTTFVEDLSSEIQFNFLPFTNILIFWINLKHTSDFNPPQHILIISDINQAHAEFVAKKIKKYLGKVFIETKSSQFLHRGNDKINFKQYDFIILNHLDDQIDHPFKIYISDYPQADDIYRALEVLAKKSKTDMKHTLFKT